MALKETSGWRGFVLDGSHCVIAAETGSSSSVSFDRYDTVENAQAGSNVGRLTPSSISVSYEDLAALLRESGYIVVREEHNR